MGKKRFDSPQRCPQCREFNVVSACVTFDGQILAFGFSARLVGSFGGDFFENQPGLKEKMYRYNNKCSETGEMHFSSDWQKKNCL